MPSAPRPQDFTGKEKARLAAEAAQAQQDRANEIALATAQAEQDFATPVDVSAAAVEVAYKPIEVVEDVEVSSPTRQMRVNTTLENMTYGHRNTYTFEEGRIYKNVPAALYNHLDRLGYVYH